MNLTDQGIIIYKTPLKERSYVVTLFTKNHGIYSGVSRIGASKNGRNRAPGIMEGNLVDFHWQARLHEHLGTAKCELIKSYNAYLIQNKIKLYAFNSIVSLIKKAFCEREPHNNFFPLLLNYIDNTRNPFCFKRYISLELAILQESGYGIDLERCADTGTKENLIYVSPKSGRAVCASSGKPYADKLLPLPQFMLNKTQNSAPPLNKSDLTDMLQLTSYFLGRYIYPNNNMPTARKQFIEAIMISDLLTQPL